MNSGFATLHKILKDETRRKIILLLNEKGSSSYTDLMKTLEISNTGRMNYHLRILGNLLSKREDGQYVLTEKGILASKLLLEFPENAQSQMNIKWSKRFWIAAALFTVTYIALILTFYLTGIIDFARMIANVFGSIVAILLLIIAYTVQMRRSRYSPQRMILGSKIGFIVFGSGIGMLIGFFGGGIILIWLSMLSHPGGVHLSFFEFAWWVIAPIIGALIGGFFGYLFHKKSKYSKITYYDPFA
jgi:MFS family permease